MKKRETEKERQTDRQPDRQKGRQTDKPTEDRDTCFCSTKLQMEEFTKKLNWLRQLQTLRDIEDTKHYATQMIQNSCWSSLM